MSRILCIDSATDICSVAIAKGEKILSFRDSGKERSHAVQLAPFIDELLKETRLEVNDFNAIAVSMGPGSYTGLRIGVSIAKGLCYGADLPLISVPTLQAMCYGANQEFNQIATLKDFYYCPMLDARRMEVYTSIFDTDYREIEPISAKIIDDDSFKKHLEDKTILFFGSGAEKTKQHIIHTNALYFDNYKHSARFMTSIALHKFEQKNFEDVAYFEPFYLKDFIATTPKKNVLLPNKK